MMWLGRRGREDSGMCQRMNDQCRMERCEGLGLPGCLILGGGRSQRLDVMHGNRIRFRSSALPTNDAVSGCFTMTQHQRGL